MRVYFLFNKIIMLLICIIIYIWIFIRKSVLNLYCYFQKGTATITHASVRSPLTATDTGVQNIGIQGRGDQRHANYTGMET